VRDYLGLVYAEMVQQQPGVACQRVKRQPDIGFGGFSETDLIRHDDAIPGVRKQTDGVFPVVASEVAPVQQQQVAAVRLAGRRHVHVGHLYHLAHHRQRQIRDRVRIRESFHGRAQGLNNRWLERILPGMRGRHAKHQRGREYMGAYRHRH